MKLVELASNGTYAALKFDKHSLETILKFLEDKNIPNPVGGDDLHCTLLFSEKPCPHYQALGDLENPHEAKLLAPDMWKTSSGKNCLVYKLNAPTIVERHNYLRETHEATHSFPSYIPHFTLSYNIPDSVKANTYGELKDLIPVVKFNHEYSKDLEL